MLNTLTSYTLNECMDGVGDKTGKSTFSQANATSASGVSRKYIVRFIIPTVNSDLEGARAMSVAGDSAEEAVRAVKAAYPNAKITQVD